jgi:hypothetical protein
MFFLRMRLSVLGLSLSFESLFQKSKIKFDDEKKIFIRP